uniref:Regulatory protein zeste n=1 Tax=Timema bartmani TaxID=61472 RepID=A0A7R9HVE4_9NEOP|nr:unnamed protein product [Timema bartmani]
MESERRCRLVYSPVEKQILFELTKKYRSILEDKTSNAETSAARKKCWLTIQREFNKFSFVTTRTPKQLMKWWDNTKNKQRREMDQKDVRESEIRGGGPLSQYRHVQYVCPITQEPVHTRGVLGVWWPLGVIQHIAFTWIGRGADYPCGKRPEIELYRPKGRRRLAKIVPTPTDRGCHGQHDEYYGI